MSGGVGSQSGMRLLAVLVFIGLPLLLGALSMLNLVQVGDNRFALAQNQTQLAAFKHRLRRSDAEAKPRDLSAIYIGGSSRSLASAILQQHMVDAISATSGRLIETSVIDPDIVDDPAGTQDVRLKTTLDTDNQGLFQLLYKLETGLPLLEVETLSVRRVQETSSEDASEILRIELGVRGKWRQSVP